MIQKNVEKLIKKVYERNQGFRKFALLTLSSIWQDALDFEELWRTNGACLDLQ